MDFFRAIWSLFFGNPELTQEQKMQAIRSRVIPQDFIHKVARCETYPGGGPKRFVVPDACVDWEVTFAKYAPVFYEAPILGKQPVWADDPKEIRKIEYNRIDKACNVDRTSAHGVYVVTQEGFPRNPLGRTGIEGRGLLGRYGPNHAADPVVTRWKRNSETHEVEHDADGNPILQFVAIRRKDNGLWALPGGMVDPGEVASATVKREFGEEALDAMSLSEAEAEKVKQDLDELFDAEHAVVVYKGYVDDPRNTDNAWMETTAVSIHDSDGHLFDKFKLQGGDDASDAKWADYTPGMELYASHTNFMAIAYEFRRGQLEQ